MFQREHTGGGLDGKACETDSVPRPLVPGTGTPGPGLLGLAVITPTAPCHSGCGQRTSSPFLTYLGCSSAGLGPGSVLASRF